MKGDDQLIGTESLTQITLGLVQVKEDRLVPGCLQEDMALPPEEDHQVAGQGAMDLYAIILQVIFLRPLPDTIPLTVVLPLDALPPIGVHPQDALPQIVVHQDIILQIVDHPDNIHLTEVLKDIIHPTVVHQGIIRRTVDHQGISHQTEEAHAPTPHRVMDL